MMHDEQDYESFAERIKIVIDLDNKLYKQVMKKRYNQSKDRAEFIYKPTVKYIKSKYQLYIRNSEYTELASMKLDII